MLFKYQFCKLIVQHLNDETEKNPYGDNRLFSSCVIGAREKFWNFSYAKSSDDQFVGALSVAVEKLLQFMTRVRVSIACQDPGFDLKRIRGENVCEFYR